jgi:hypothetical protein
MGLGPHGVHAWPSVPLGGGFQVKDSAPRVVWQGREGVPTGTRTCWGSMQIKKKFLHNPELPKIYLLVILQW